MTRGPFGLPWLLPTPPDFKSRARAALAASSLDAGEVRKLAAYALDLNDLETMGKLVNKHRAALVDKAGLTPIRLGIASSHTMQYVASALPGSALRHNLVQDVLLVGLDPKPWHLMESELGVAAPDAVLIALDYRLMGLAEAQLTPQDGDAAVGRAINYATELATRVRGSGAICILQTLVPPTGPLFGNMDSRVPGSVRAMVERFNEVLVHEMARENDLVLDAAFLASAVGLSTWNYARDWHQARLPCALDSTPLYADHICRLLGAASGRARKCLVMDLDDTLWGGAIARDGVEGIRLGQGTNVGEAHVALQRYALALRRRGVILAICSRNGEADARLPFRAHPEMVLKEEDIEVFFANSSNKVRDIREIAVRLNITTDSVVFLDPDPADRARVREMLPEVAVPELPADPADYASLLSTAGYFEATRFCPEDQDKVEGYIDLRAKDLDMRLESLDMIATVSPFNAASRDRVAHLIAANHLSLANRRYSERDIEEFGSSPWKFCLQISLADRYGDKGIVSVVIFDRVGDEWRCDIWLLSRKAVGRRVNELALAVVAQAAAGTGASRLVGACRPTAENAEMIDHFTSLGFIKGADLAGGQAEWVLDLSTYEMPSLPFKVVRPN